MFNQLQNPNSIISLVVQELGHKVKCNSKKKKKETEKCQGPKQIQNRSNIQLLYYNLS